MGLHYLLPLFFTLRNYYLEKEMQKRTDDWGGGGDYASGQRVVYSVFIANV
jgi:hypothetical protein